jgi:hypothetical protein
MTTKALAREAVEAEAIAREIGSDVQMGYLMVRVLPDNSIAALGELLFTRAIYLGVDRLGWERRFCFENRDLALKRFLALNSEDDEPEGYTARRPA